MVEVSTSILTVEEEGAVKKFYGIETAKTDYFHIDVMDGKFVKNNTKRIMHEYSNTLSQMTRIPLDVHLMVYSPMEYVKEYIDLRPNIITVHVEAFENKEELLDVISYIKENNTRVGIAIKPNTKIEEILEYIHLVHVVLVMTVEPGLGGQKLIPETLEKISKVKDYITKNNLEIYIEADGGINLETISEVKNSGTDIIVAGSAIINSENYKKTINLLKTT